MRDVYSELNYVDQDVDWLEETKLNFKIRSELLVKLKAMPEKYFGKKQLVKSDLPEFQVLWDSTNPIVLHVIIDELVLLLNDNKR